MPNSTKEARAQRLKTLRALTGRETQKQLSRATLERKYGISASTLRHWEEAYGAGLTVDGAKQMINVYQQEGIHCTISWLLDDKGPPPHLLPSLSETAPPEHGAQTILKEANYFKSLHPEALIFTVKDDAMLPFYLPGDCVGGVRHYRQSILTLIGYDCIIEAKSGDCWLRRIQKSTITNHYNLYALNANTKVVRPHRYDEEIIAAAPVTRIWRGKRWD